MMISTMLSIMDAYDDNGEIMRHQIGTMMDGIEGTEADECNIQGEFTLTLQQELTLETTS